MTPADQDPPTSENRSFAPDEAESLVVVEHAELRSTYPVSELLGRPVMNDAGERIGTLDDLMLDSGDRISFAILSVGGFIGLGAHQVVISLADLAMSDDELVLPGASRETLGEMTGYQAEQARSERAPLRRARRGVKDAGEIVTTFGDEPISGIVADVTDEDRRR